MTTFQPLKQLAQGGVFFPPGAQILLKWSKTLQMNNSVRLIKVSYLASAPICPVSALKTLSLTPKGPNKPLFQVKYREQWVPLSDTRLRKHFSIILARLQLHQSNISFHSLRHSGATWAFNANVPRQNIQSHGTWMPVCVWSYITQDHQTSDAVALTSKSYSLPDTHTGAWGIVSSYCHTNNCPENIRIMAEVLPPP